MDDTNINDVITNNENLLANTNNESYASANNIIVNISGDYDFNIDDIREQIKKLPIGNKLIDDELDIIIIQIKNTIELNTKKQHQIAINNFFNELKEHIDDDFLNKEIDEFNEINMSDSMSEMESLCEILDLNDIRNKLNGKSKTYNKKSNGNTTTAIKTKKINNTETNIKTKKVKNKEINSTNNMDISNDTGNIEKKTSGNNTIQLNKSISKTKKTEKDNTINITEKKTKSKKIINNEINNEMEEINGTIKKMNNIKTRKYMKQKNKISDEISNEILKKMNK